MAEDRGNLEKNVDTAMDYTRINLSEECFGITFLY